MPLMSITEDVSQEPMGSLKAMAPANMPLRLVTEEMSQEPMG